MKYNSWRPTGVRLVALLVLVLCGSCAAFAQRITGSIAGTVKDEQGAMVTTAAIKATNTETGFNRTTPVNGDGSFLIQYLPVGPYTVAVEAAGFKKFVQQNVTVAVDQTVPLAVTLTVGAQTQTVEVTEAPPLVETSTAELGRSVSPAEIISLPLVNRNAYAQLSLTAGVMSNSASPQSNPNGTPNFQYGVPSTQVIVNGGIDAGVPTVSYYLDGGINMTGLRNYGNPLPNPDALQEFRVETNNFAAQYGRMSGGVVTAVTKSGTNQFHGSLFEFNRNTALNAYNWRSATAAHYRRNQFGGAVGGPIKHDKAFAFFSYAGLRQVVGQQLTGAIVPTANERLGDFTADSGVTIYMPGTYNPKTKTGTLVNGINTGSGCTTLGANTPGKCVPQALLDKAAATLMNKYVPLPTGAAAANGGAAYSGFFTGPTNQDEYLGKFDDVLSDRDHVAASYFYLSTTQDAYGNGNIPYMINRSYSKQHVLNLSDIHTLNATTANQAWITFTRVVGGRTNYPTVGLEDLGSTFTTQGPKTLPQLSVSGFFSAGGALAGPVNATTFYSIRDMISKTRGKHSLDFGGEVSFEKDPVLGNLENFGNFSFSSSAPTTTNNALSDFVTGQVASMEQDTPYYAVTSNWYYALFVQDTYRIAPRLTLNLGLRYDMQQAPVESKDRNLTFSPNVQSTKLTSAPKGLLFPGDKGVPRGITDNRYHHISPRVGISWDPFGDGKTAVRAGAGVFYGSVVANEWNQPANAQPFAVRQTFNSITSFSDVYSNKSSFPNGDPFPYTYTAANPRFLTDASVEAISKDYQWPLAYQFNVAIQRQLPLNISATAAYVSTLTRHMPFFTDANYAPYAAGATTLQASIDARRPYNNNFTLGQVLYLESQENASYHALQITAHRPLAHNLMLNGFYVFSKNLETVNPGGVGGGTAQNFNNLWEERGPTDNDRRHVASISALWKLQYYTGENRIVKQIANGWTISPIISLQSGTPVNITTGTNNNFDSGGSDRPNLVSGQNWKLDAHRDRTTAAAAWFNKAAFIANGPGVTGGIGTGAADGNTPRDYMRAPGYRNVDLGLLRDFHLQRGIVFQIRGEATNAFNMVSLNGPTASLSSANNGKITSAGTPRLIQVGGRFTF
jgi:hypothetical protein